jgi:hypothetical protein
VVIGSPIEEVVANNENPNPNQKSRAEDGPAENATTNPRLRAYIAKDDVVLLLAILVILAGRNLKNDIAAGGSYTGARRAHINSCAPPVLRSNTIHITPSFDTDQHHLLFPYHARSSLTQVALELEH